MNEAKLGLDELYAIGEMEMFYKAAKEKCEKKIGATRFAGMDREDVVQEALLKVHRYLPKYDATKAKLSTWVDRVLSSMIKDMLEKAGTEKNLSVVNAASLDLYACVKEAPFSDYADQGQAYTVQVGGEDYGYENAELMIDFLEYIQLSKREKEVFNLRAAGYSPSEIADLLQVSASRVSQLWKSIIQKYEQAC
ncbi:sigma-70 family RNA polymerase sigma factor [Paenibacillus sp. NPDC058071]|uniref:sigma-70 family RNA polymerase sigma factor n=1 Tax=Paenibacillus sp. NPDC058071 TaxID=3346326 RepID=UPI0036DD8650